ncbi:MAG: DUF2029 domain-containing protein [Planctomycetes bacterium]|nr:DUF2029 domain-containing protein [Planctomycetota bacterium]
MSAAVELRQQRLLRWCRVGFGLLGAFVLLRAVLRPEHRGVILDHLEFGRRLWLGEPVYAPWPAGRGGAMHPLHPPYPPSFGLLTMPFAGLAALGGTPLARAGWAILQLACAVGVARLLRRLAEPWVPNWSALRWYGLWALLLLLGGRFLLRDLHGGGGNLVNLWLCLAAFAAASSGRERLAGLWLGCSLATKPTQLWLWPLLLLFGQRRAAGWTLLCGAGAALASLALLRFDPACWVRWVQGSVALAGQADAFAEPELGFPPFTWMNQSLRCALARWLGTVPEPFAAQVELWPPEGLGLPVPHVAWLARALHGALLVGLYTVAWRARRSPSAQPVVLAAALVASVLLSPLSWKAHHTALLPALAGAVVAAHLGVRWLGWLLGVWFVACALPGRDLVGDRVDELGNSLYLVTLGDTVLLATALVAAWRLAGRSAPPQHHEPLPSAALGQRLR